MLHDQIVSMGVDAEVGRMAKAVIQQRRHNAMALGQTSYAMNDKIRFIIEPSSVDALARGQLVIVDGRIRWFGPGDERKSTYWLAISIEHQIAAASLDVSLEDLGRWITAHPLTQIAAATHNGACRFSQTKQGWKVFECGFANLVHLLGRKGMKGFSFKLRLL